MAVELTRRRFTADEYQWMGRVGILRPDERVELIDGEVVEMAPIGPEHGETVDELNERFVRGFSDVARVRVQGAVRLQVYDEPQPDIALLRRRPSGYAAQQPGADDILLVVEVAASSLATDRRVKVPRYARAKVPEVWLISLPEQAVHVHREPEGDRYRSLRTAHRGESIAPLAFPDRPIAIDDLLIQPEQPPSV